MPTDEQTKNELKRYLKEAVSKVIAHRLQENAEGDPHDDEQKPFHKALLGEVIAQASRFERSFSTILGKTFEKCALMIAQRFHKQSERDYKLKGLSPEQAVSKIEDLIRELGESSSRPKSLPEMIDEVLTVAEKSSDSYQEVSINSDLYLVTNSSEEIFIELKSPKPNKDQCEKAIRRILMIHLIRRKQTPQVQAYIAFPYNPYGDKREDYQWNIVHRYLPDEAWLIGEEFWELIGGKNTYQSLLSLYQEVGEEMREDILRALGVIPSKTSEETDSG